MLELRWSRRIWKQCTWNKILILKIALDQDSLNLLGKYSGKNVLKECYIFALYLVLLLTHFKTKHHTCDFIICSCKKMNECASVSLYVLKRKNVKTWFPSFHRAVPRKKGHHSLTIEAARFTAELQQLLVRFVRWSEDKNPRVEAVGPTRVWCCRQLLPLKELIDVW